MTTSDPAETLRRYYAALHEAVLWKLEGLSERQLRTPLTPTGSNLLGLAKHLAMVEYGYFGDCLGREAPQFEDLFGPDAPPNADMYARADEPAAQWIDALRAAGEYVDRTFREVPLDAEGEVPWWPEDRRRVTLHLLAIHMGTELARHAGQIDILRELTDERVGLRPGMDNLPAEGSIDWPAYVAELRGIAERFE